MQNAENDCLNDSLSSWRQAKDKNWNLGDFIVQNMHDDVRRAYEQHVAPTHKKNWDWCSGSCIANPFLEIVNRVEEWRQLQSATHAVIAPV